MSTKTNLKLFKPSSKNKSESRKLCEKNENPESSFNRYSADRES